MRFYQLSYKEKRKEVIKHILVLIFLVCAMIYLFIAGIIAYNTNTPSWVLLPLICIGILYVLFNLVIMCIQLRYIVTDKTVWVFLDGKGYPELYFIPWMDEGTHDYYLKYLEERKRHGL